VYGWRTSEGRGTVLLAALVVVAALAANSPTVPLQQAENGRPPISQQQAKPSNQTQHGDAGTDQKAGTSSAAPLYVKAACEHGCGYSEDNKGWWQKLWTDPVASFTTVLAMLTAGLIGVGISQGRLIARQITLGRDEFNATHRPEIVVHSAMAATAVMRGSKTAIGASITYFNKGTTPATNVEICALIVPMQYGMRPQDRIAIPVVREPAPDSVIPGRPYFFNVWSDVEHHRAELRGGDTTLPPEATVYCIGTVSYDDGAGVRRQTGFCWRWEQDRRWESDYLSSYYYSY